MNSFVCEGELGLRRLRGSVINVEKDSTQIYPKESPLYWFLKKKDCAAFAARSLAPSGMVLKDSKLLKPGYPAFVFDCFFE